MSKKRKRPEKRWYSVPARFTFRGVVWIEAESPEVAVDAVGHGYFDDTFITRASLSDCEATGDAAEDRD